jgi:hypothetical protein
MESFGIFHRHLVYFGPFGILYGNVVYLWQFLYIFPVLVYCTKKNLATLEESGIFSSLLQGQAMDP